MHSEAVIDLTNFTRIMAIDFGTQKYGMAVANITECYPQPLASYVVRDGIPEWSKLLSIIDEQQIDLCIVGLPLNMDDSENELCARVRKFARRLKHHSQLSVWMVDERLSTKEAREQVAALKHQHLAKKLSVDSLAASLLLEQFIQNPVARHP